MNIGIVGGMGPWATHYFVQEVLAACQKYLLPKKDQDYPSFIVDYACHIPDRTSSLLLNPQPLIDALNHEIDSLISLGCQLIVVPCITAHAVFEKLPSNLPVLDIRNIVAKHIRKVNPNSLVGVLGTRGTRITGTALKFGPAPESVVVLEMAEEDDLMSIIYQQIKSDGTFFDLSLLRKLISSLRNRGADAIVAGCTEIEMVLAKSGIDDESLIFPLRLTAFELIKDLKEESLNGKQKNI